MGLLLGFAPWIVYWVLVGNAPFLLAILVSLALAVAGMIVGRIKKLPGLTFEIGTLGTFFLLTILTLTVSKSFLERWLAPLSYVGIFGVVLIGVLIGKPFVREFASIVQPPEVTDTDLYLRVTTVLTWIWVVAYGAMTASAAVPPIFHGDDATLLDEGGGLSAVFYWVIPFSLMGIAALVTRMLPNKMIRAQTPASPDEGDSAQS